jgi:hypothetical protein
MTPAERRQLEAAYDRFYQLYDEGKIRPAELDEMDRIYEQLGPTWQAEAEQERIETQPTFQAREPSVAEDVGAWLGRNVYEPLGFNERSAQREGGKLSGLMEFLPGPGTVMAGAQVPRDIRAGNYGMAALNAATVPLDLLAAGPVRRGAVGLVDDVQQGYRQRQLPDGYAYMTNEAVPYRAVGSNVTEGEFGVDAARVLPGLEDATPEQLAAFSADPRRSWVNPETGGDILSEAIGARTLPTLQGQGMYDGPRGVEFNPLSIGRSYATPQELQATESLRGLLDVQGGTPWTRLASGELPTVFLPKTRPGDVDEMLRLKEVGEQYGLSDVVDVGEGYILTNYMGGAADTGREARRALERASGLKAVRTTAQSGYPGYEGAWEKGGGAAIRRYLENIEGADPQALAALENSDAVRKAAAARAMANQQQAGEFGGTNKTVAEIQRTVQRGGEWTPKLEAYAQRLEDARIPPQLPVLRFPEPSPLSVTHISPEARDVLDPFKAFTNPRMRGAEQQLDPAVYPRQTYFGVGVGQPGGYVPEGALGRVTHQAELPQERLLDISQGWGDIAAEADALVARRGPLTPQAADSLKQAAMMRIAKMRGYEGLYNPSHSLGPIATSFYEVTPTARGLLD